MDDATQPVTPSPTASGAHPAGPAAADLVGTTVGDFRILRRLGRGGMGQVYLAEQLSLRRKVALKFLRPDAAVDPTALSRFRREAEAVARVTHANIVQVYSIGEADGRHYMALEFVEGRNLKEYLDRKSPVDLPVALMIMRQVSAALQRAADSGIVHRDIKPENILMTRKGEVKVADFGLSRGIAGEQDLSLTQSGVTMGTPLYMSPEQARGGPLDPRSDIYSFGVTCYHMLAGQPPFRGRTAYDVALKHVNEQPPPLTEARPDVPPWLASLVHRMMSKDPAERPQSGREVLRELGQQQTPVEASSPFAGMSPTARSGEVAVAAAGPPGGKPIARRTAAAVAVSLALAAGLGFGLKSLRSAGSPSAGGMEDAPNLPVVSEQERFLLAAVERYATPTKPDKIRQGAGHHVELGVFYWQQRRYTDAEHFFEEVIRRPNAPAPYRTIAALGLAVTFGLRDEVDRSNKAFLEVKNLGTGFRSALPQALLPLEDWINLRDWVLTALDRNATRPPLPKELDDLRRELKRPLPIGPRGGKAG